MQAREDDKRNELANFSDNNEANWFSSVYIKYLIKNKIFNLKLLKEGLDRYINFKIKADLETKKLSSYQH